MGGEGDGDGAGCGSLVLYLSLPRGASEHTQPPVLRVSPGQDSHHTLASRVHLHPARVPVGRAGFILGDGCVAGEGVEEWGRRRRRRRGGVLASVTAQAMLGVVVH
jgi:hypothetical protein